MAALADPYGHSAWSALPGALHDPTSRPTQGLIMANNTPTYFTAFENLAMSRTSSGVLTVRSGGRE
jgi:hypothetical protein